MISLILSTPEFHFQSNVSDIALKSDILNKLDSKSLEILLLMFEAFNKRKPFYLSNNSIGRIVGLGACTVSRKIRDLIILGLVETRERCWNNSWVRGLTPILKTKPLFKILWSFFKASRSRFSKGSKLTVNLYDNINKFKYLRRDSYGVNLDMVRREYLPVRAREVNSSNQQEDFNQKQSTLAALKVDEYPRDKYANASPLEAREILAKIFQKRENLRSEVPLGDRSVRVNSSSYNPTQGQQVARGNSPSPAGVSYPRNDTVYIDKKSLNRSVVHNVNGLFKNYESIPSDMNQVEDPLAKELRMAFPEPEMKKVDIAPQENRRPEMPYNQKTRAEQAKIQNEINEYHAEKIRKAEEEKRLKKEEDLKKNPPMSKEEVAKKAQEFLMKMWGVKC